MCVLARFSKQQSGHLIYLNGINAYSEKANLEICGGVWGFQDGRMGNHLGEVGWSSDDINTPSVQDKASVVSPPLVVVQCLAVIWLTHSKSLDTKVISGTAQTCLNAYNCINVTMYLDNNYLWRCETILSVSRFFDCLFVTKQNTDLWATRKSVVFRINMYWVISQWKVTQPQFVLYLLLADLY